MIDDTTIPNLYVFTSTDGTLRYSVHDERSLALNHETFHLFCEAVDTIVNDMVQSASDLKAEVSAKLRKPAHS